MNYEDTYVSVSMNLPIQAKMGQKYRWYTNTTNRGVFSKLAVECLSFSLEIASYHYVYILYSDLNPVSLLPTFCGTAIHLKSKPASKLLSISFEHTVFITLVERAWSKLFVGAYIYFHLSNTFVLISLPIFYSNAFCTPKDNKHIKGIIYKAFSASCKAKVYI